MLGAVTFRVSRARARGSRTLRAARDHAREMHAALAGMIRPLMFNEADRMFHSKIADENDIVILDS